MRIPNSQHTQAIIRRKPSTSRVAKYQSFTSRIPIVIQFLREQETIESDRSQAAEIRVPKENEFFFGRLERRRWRVEQIHNNSFDFWCAVGMSVPFAGFGKSQSGSKISWFPFASSLTGRMFFPFLDHFEIQN